MSNLRNCKIKLDAYRASKRSNDQEKGDSVAKRAPEMQDSTEVEVQSVEDATVDVERHKTPAGHMDDVGAGASEADTTNGVANDESDYEVEEILGEKRFKLPSGQFILMYQVKWHGYDKLTCEPLKNMGNCMDKVEVYKAGRTSAAHGQREKLAFALAAGPKVTFPTTMRTMTATL